MDTLAFRLEICDKGPFSTDFLFNTIQTLIKETGYKRDQFDTTFLNYYDQRSRSPIFNPEVQAILNADGKSKRLRFGFSSKEVFELEFGIDTGYHDRTFQKQFESLLNENDIITVKAYLVKPEMLFHDEVVYFKDNAVLVDVAHTYSQFLKL